MSVGGKSIVYDFCAQICVLKNFYEQSYKENVKISVMEIKIIYVESNALAEFASSIRNTVQGTTSK